MTTSTKAVGDQPLPVTTKVVTGGQDLALGTLKVAALTGFDTPSGQFTVAGFTGTCNYSGTSGTDTFTGITGCSGKPADGAIVSRVAPLSLKVISLDGFDTSDGQFNASGMSGTCSYTGTSGGDTFTGITGCTGSVKDGGNVTRVAKLPGVYKWDDGSSAWQFQTAGIPAGTSFPASPANGDYFQLTKTPATTVSGGSQTLGSTLNVASTIGFLAPAGTFTVAGVTGTCTYTGTTSTSFTGITGCTGTPADGAAVTATTAAGIYKRTGSTWTYLGDGSVFPTTPASGDYFRLAEHDISAEAESGAGGDKDKVSIAGALALNLVSNHTEAIVPGAAHITAATGDVTLKAKSNEEDVAKADSDAKSGKVGIGASAAIQVLDDNITRAAIEDNAVFSGGANLEISASARRDIETEDKAGSEGSTLALSPSVSIAIVNDKTSAYLGSGALLTVSGDATIEAEEELSSSLDANAKAGGPDVAIGAAVAVNVVETTTSADLERSLTAASVTVESTTEASTTATTEASAQGEKSDSDGGKKADDQSKDQVGNNPNTTGKTDGALPTAKGGSTNDGTQGTDAGNSQTGSQGGDSNSGGVDIAAAVSVNWARYSNKASIGNGTNKPVVTATSGAVKVSAENLTGATAKATGLSVDLGSSSTHISAAVGLNVATVTNDATVGQGVSITAHGITVEAVNTSDKENDFIVWGFSAAGGASSGSGASIAGSVGVEILSFHTEASVGQGVTLTSNGDIEVTAKNKIGLQNLALAGGGSAGSAAIGGAIAVNVFPDITTEAFIDSGTSAPNVTQVDALGGLSVSATSVLKEAPAPVVPLITLPLLSSVALSGGISTGGAAVSGSVIVDVFFLTTKAYIGPGAQVNQHPELLQPLTDPTAQTIEVKATDDTSLTNLAGGLSFSSSGAGIGIGIVVDVIKKQVQAYIAGSTNVTAAGDITVSAASTENFHELAIDFGGSSSSAAVDGSVIVVVLNAGDDAIAKAEVGGTVHSSHSFGITASDSMTALLLAGGAAISGASAGVAFSVIVIDRHGRVDAGVDANANLQASGGTGLTVSATQSEDLTLLAVGGAGGDSVGIAGSADIDLLVDHTLAHIDSNVTIGGSTAGLAVAATDDTKVLGLAGTLAIGGTAGVGAGVDVEDINKDTEAWVNTGGTATVTGNATIDAISTENITSISVGGGFGGTAAVNVNAGVSVIDVTTKAFVADGTSGNHAKIFADGSVRVAADETLTLNEIAGNISGGGSAAVGAAVAVPVVTKNTYGYIGNWAEVNGAGGTALPVKTGNYSVGTIDTRFNGANVSSSTIDLGPDNAPLQDGQEVIYDNGGGASIGNLTDAGVDTDGSQDGIQSAVYYVHTSDGRHIQLSSTPGGSIIPITPGAGESHRLVPTNQAGVRKDDSPRFDPHSTDVDYTTFTFTLPYDPGVANDDSVIYSAGGGTPIGNLVDGQTYYAENVSGNSLQLYTAKISDGGTVVHVTDPGPNAGRSHSIVKQSNLPAGDASAAGPRDIQNPEESFRGVAVTSTNSDDIAAVGIAAGIAGSAAVSISGVVTVVETHTDAHVGSNAKINCDRIAGCGTNPGTQNAVRVAAANQFYQLGITASLAIGGDAGVAVPVSVRLVKLNSDAYVGDHTTINAAKDVSITSNGKDAAVTVVAGAGGGMVGVAGSVSVTILNTHTYASTSNHVTINAGGNVLVSATEPSKITLVVASIAGGFVGVGAAVGVLSGTKDTRAFLGDDNTVTAGACCSTIDNTIFNGQVFDDHFGTLPHFSGIAVQAASSEDVFGITVSAAGGFVGVAVGVGVTLLSTVTEAVIGDNANLNTSGGVNVSAVDYAKTITIGGGAAGGFVGVGGGVDIGVLNVTVVAQVGTGTINAVGDVDVNALSRKNVRTIAISLGGGFVGAAGSVAVWTVGTQPTTTYSDQGSSKNPLSSGGGSSASEADNTATSTPDDWHMNGAYKQGDIVRFSGQNYTALDDIADTADNPATNTGEWAVTQNGGYGTALNGTSGSSGSDTAGVMNTRMNGVKSTSTSKISSNTPTTGPTAAALANLTAVQGTKASLNATVTTTVGGVHVRAEDSTEFNGLAGTAAGGLVGIGASVLIMSVQTTTEAQVGSSANISAAGDVLVEASQNNEQIHGLAFTGVAGAVALEGEVVVINDTSSQNAHIDTGAKIKKANGGAVVNAHADRHEDALTFGVGLGVVAGGVSIAIMNAHGDTTASIGNVAIGTDVTGGTKLGSLTVNADADISPTATAYSVEAGVGGGLSGAVALTTVDGKTRAQSDAHGNVGNGSTASYCGAGATGVCVHAKGTHGAVEADSFNVSTGFLAFGITRTEATDDRSTEAQVTGGTISSDGNYLVLAYSTHFAKANAPAASGGAVSVTAMLPKATISGHTSAELDGTVSKSTSTTVQADSQNSVLAEAFVGGLAVIGIGGAFADAEITSGAYTDAIVGSSGSIQSTGEVLIEAIQHGDKNKAVATAKAIEAPGILAAALLVSKTVIGGRVKAELGGNISGSNDVHVHAESANNADSDTFVVVVGAFAGAGSGAEADITTDATTQALIDSTANPITSNGQVHVEAKSANTATAHDEAGAGGVVAGALNLPTATVAGGTKATFDGTIASAGSLLVEATGSNFANAESEVVTIGAIGLGGAKADAEITSDAAIEALGGSTAGATLGSGAAEVDATGTNIATAKTSGTTVSLVSLSIFAPITKIDTGVKATYDGKITSAGSLTVKARGENIAFSHAYMFSLSIDGGGGSLPDSALGSNTNIQASIGSGADISVSGAVLVDAGQNSYVADANPVLGHDADFVGETNLSFAQSDGTGGGAITIGIYTSNSKVESSVLAKLDGKISGAGSVEVKSIGTNHSKADTSALGIGAIAIAGAGAHAEVDGDAVVSATAASTADITTTGSVKFTADSHHHAEASADVATGGIVSVGVALPTAEAGGTTKAEYDGKVKNATEVTIQATGENNGYAKSHVISIGLVGGSGASSCSVAGSSGGSSCDTAGTIGSTVATVGSSAAFDMPNGAVTVKATGTNVSTADGGSDGGGLVSVSVSDPNAYNFGDTKAEFLGSIKHGTNGPGALALTVQSQGNDNSVSTIRTFNVGAIEIGLSASHATNSSTVEANLGSNGSFVSVTNNVTVAALDTTDADAATDSSGGGALAISSFTSNAVDDPTIVVTVNSGAEVDAGGTIDISAKHNEVVGGVFDGSFDANNVDTSNGINGNTIVFSVKHNLKTGDVVNYDTGTNPPGAAVNPLVQGRPYNVIVPDVNGDFRVQLGAVFLGSSIDSATDTIAFSGPHNLETGDRVFYFVPSGSTAVSGLTSGSEYTVLKVDDTHIKLQNQAVKTASGNASQIDNGTHFINFSNTFSSGDLVTYHAPAPLESFSPFQVDQTFNSNNNPAYTSTNNNQIFFAKDSGDANHTPTGFGFAAGTALVYDLVSGPPIAGLTPGGTYYLITTGDSLEIKLAGTVCDALGIDKGGDGICGNGDDGVVGSAPIVALGLTPDKSTGVTTVNQPNVPVNLSSGTLHVASTNGFNSSGTFTVSGIAGRCSYTGTTSTTFTGITGCTGTPTSGASVTGSANGALYTLSLANNAKIPQLQDGHNYYVINPTSSHFQLSSTDPAITTTLVNVTDGGHTGGPHVFSLEGVDLTGAGGGQQRLVLDLTNTVNATQRLIGAGGSAFTTPSVGDGVTTASATGFAVGALTISGGHATASSDPTVRVNIGGSTANPTNLNAEEIDVTTNDVVQVKAASTNDGGGLIGVGDAQATGTAKSTSTVTIGADAQLTSLGNILIRSRSELHISGSTDPNIVGFIGVARAKTNLTVDYQTETDVNGGINAGAAATIDARTYVDGSASARANGAGFGADSDATARLEVGTSGRGGLTEVDFGGTKQVNADTLSVNALVERARLSSDAYTRSTAAGAGSTADAHSIINGSNQIILEPGSFLIGGSSLFLTSEYDNVDVYAHAHSICRCFGGYTHPDADAQIDTTAFVNGKPNSSVKSASLVVTVNQFVVRFQADSDRDGAFLDFGSADSNGSPNSPKRHITWESQTYLLGEPNPVLIIDDTGKIVAKTNNVTVRANSAAGAPLAIGDHILAGQTIFIDPILYDKLPAALFRANKITGTDANDSNIDGTQAIFYMQETWDSVTIINNFDAPIVILANDPTTPTVSISTLNASLTSNPEAVISVSVTKGAETSPSVWRFDIKHYFPATSVQVLSIRGPPLAAATGFDLTINGDIRNTIGSTTIENDRGNIAVGASAVFTSNVLHLNSDLGSIGSLANPVRAVLVQWDCSGTLFCTSPHPKPVVLTAEAGVDVFIDLTTIRRDSTTAAVSTALVPIIGPINAGHDIWINVNDSSEGIDSAAVGELNVNRYTPDDQPSPFGSGPIAETVPTWRHFRPDTVFSPDVIGDPPLLVAYGIVLTKIDANYRFCGDNSCTTAGVTAGHNIDIHHSSTAANVTFDVLSNVDATFADSNRSGLTPGNHDNSGRIDLKTNGSILDIEMASDLRAGQIWSTGVCDAGSPCSLAVAAAWFVNAFGDVTLRSPGAILDAESDAGVLGTDPNPSLGDVIGRNITMTAGNNGMGGTEGHGGVGTPGDFLETDVNADGGALGVLTITDNDVTDPRATWNINRGGGSDAAHLFAAGTNNLGSGTGTFGVFVTEAIGDLEVNRILTNGDASLVTVAGSIVDARNNGAGLNTVNGLANVEANNVDLDANGGSIGTPQAIGSEDVFGNDFKIDSSFAVTGRLGAEATQDIYVTETNGALNVLLAQALTGNVRLTVREHSGQGDDLNLIHPSDTVHADQNENAILVVENLKRDILVTNMTTNSPSINALNGWILLRVGDNITLGGLDPSFAPSLTDAQRIAQNTKVVAGLWIDIHGDYDAFSGGGQLDTGFGTVMHLHGTITPGPLAGGCVNEINPGRDCNVTRIFGNTDADTITFDQTYLGGRTRVDGSVAPTCTAHTASACVGVYPPADGQDFITVNGLQTMFDPSSAADATANPTTGDVRSAHTLTLDGQAGTDTYVINTTGSQACLGANQISGSTCHNYVINVLDTGAPDDGADVLIVNGVDGSSTFCSGYKLDGSQCPTDDIFLLRASQYIASTPTSATANEIADDPAFVALAARQLRHCNTGAGPDEHQLDPLLHGRLRPGRPDDQGKLGFAVRCSELHRRPPDPPRWRQLRRLGGRLHDCGARSRRFQHHACRDASDRYLPDDRPAPDDRRVAQRCHDRRPARRRHDRRSVR